MNINFNGFNMGDIPIDQNSFGEIQKICADHPACKNCPVYDNYGLHNSNTVTMCQKTAERIVKEQRNGNNGQV